VGLCQPIVFGGVDGLGQQHGDGHGADSARHGRDQACPIGSVILGDVAYIAGVVATGSSNGRK